MNDTRDPSDEVDSAPEAFSLDPDLSGGDSAQVADLVARHQDELLAYPNVVGVGAGLRTVGGQTTQEPALLVFVTEKVPASELPPGGLLPEEIDGVPVDVVAVGEIRPLGT